MKESEPGKERKAALLDDWLVLVPAETFCRPLSQGLGEKRSIASHCWFVLLGVLRQSQRAPVLPYTTGPEKSCTGNKSMCPLSSEMLKKKKGGSLCESSCITIRCDWKCTQKVSKAWVDIVHGNQGWQCSWYQMYLKSSTWNLIRYSLHICCFLYISFISSFCIALFESQMQGE